MVKYILQRLLAMILSLVVITSITFVFMHSIPGGPFTREKPLAPAIIAALNEKYHLDDPLPKQYIDYMVGLAHGDMGPSFAFKNREINDMILDSFPYTFKLGILAIFVALFLGIPLGIIAALRQNKTADYGVMIITTLGVTIPSFVMAAILMFVFSVKLNWLPTVSSTLDTPKTYVLPVVALTGTLLSFVTRLMRSAMLDALQQDYIRTARAKGISEFKIIMKHAFKNAVLPVVTYVGTMVAAELTGSFIIEKMFTIPGLGQWFVSAIQNRDYTMILGSCVFYSVILIVMTFVVDITYGFIDPRIRLYGGKESA